MKKSWNRALSALLAVMMIVSLLVVPAGASPVFLESEGVAETPADLPSASEEITSTGSGTLFAGSGSSQAELFAAGTPKTLDFATAYSDVTSGGTDGTIGTQTKGDFTIVGNATKGRIDGGQNKWFPDGYHGTVRLNYGAKTDHAEQGGTYVQFTTTAKALVKVWWVHAGDPASHRQMAIFDTNNTQVEGLITAETAIKKNGPAISYILIPDAGTYRLGAAVGSNYLFKVEVTEGADVAVPTVTKVNGDMIGTPTIAVTPTQKDGATVEGSWDVEVTGTKVGLSEDGLTQYADTLSVELWDKSDETKAAATVATNGEGNELTYVDPAEGVTVTLKAPGTGTYTIKAVAKQGSDVTLTSAESSEVSYVLPLAKPVVTAQPGDTSVTLTWNEVPEATSYEVYNGTDKVTVTPTEAEGKYTAEITGLTNETEYTFTVKALRADPSAEATSEAVKATPTGVVADTKEVTYTLDVSALDNIAGGSLGVGATKKVGTDNFFTIRGGTKITLEANNTTYTDFTATKRLKTGITHKADVTDATKDEYYKNNSVSFETAGSAKVTVYWRAGGSGERYLAIWDADGKAVVQTAKSADSSTPYTHELTLNEAGVYYIVSPANGCNINKIVAKVQEPNFDQYTLDVDAETETLALGTKITDPVTIDTAFTLTNTRTDKDLIVKQETDETTGKAKVITFPDASEHTNFLDNGGEIKANTTVGYQEIKFTMSKKGGVKIWWRASGDTRPLKLQKLNEDGTATADFIYTSTNGAKKNDVCLDTVNLEAGTYRIGGNKPLIYKIEITPGREAVIPSNATWDEATIGKPVLGTIAQDGGTVTVPVSGVMIGTVEDKVAKTATTYAEKVVVSMMDKDGKVLDTQEIAVLSDKSKTNTAEFTPADSGDYTFKAEAVRSGEETTIASAVSAAFTFSYPLGTPNVSANSEGRGADGLGTISLHWVAIHEATGYNVYQNGTKVTETPITDHTYLATGLTIGTEYTFEVEAVRDAEVGPKSAAVKETATAAKLVDWRYAAFGPSTTSNTTDNGYTETRDADGNLVSVQLYAKNGKGKIQDSNQNGLVTYYTPIPTSKNFTLRAHVHVDTWKADGAQNGFGLAAMDAVDASGASYADPTASFWNNIVMVGASKSEFQWNSVKETLYGKVGKNGQAATYPAAASGTSFAMRLGLASRVTAGVPKGYTAAANPPTSSLEYHPLEKYIVNMEKGTYNSIGNCDGGPDSGAITPTINGKAGGLTDFILEVQRNNTGYFVSYYEYDGYVEGVSKPYQVNNLTAENYPEGTDMKKLSSATQKHYDPTILDVLDEDYVYAGFYVARNMTCTFDDIKLTTIDPDADVPAEPHPYEYIDPSVTITSPDVSNTKEYVLSVYPNVKGRVVLTVDGEPLKGTTTDGVALDDEGGLEVAAGERVDINVELGQSLTQFVAVLYVDPDQGWAEDEYKLLSNTFPCQGTKKVTKYAGKPNRQLLYVAPSPIGKDKGSGSRTSPLDIDSAVKMVQAGQTIVLMEGTYKRTNPLRIERGIDGTAEKPIRMIADPKATTRPVLDFLKTDGCGGVVLSGDYWYCKGFDVTNSGDKQKGFHVTGHHNVLDQIKTYNNGDSGIQISTLTSASDKKELDWPSYNLILNCDSYYNADSSNADADGFAAKLQVGPGNVFDGCVSHHNADDGWDLFAKSEHGAIGTVTIKNSITYANGYHVTANGDVIGRGNGNGFKMGGNNIEGGHILINSVTFWNLSKGIDANSCPDIQVENSTTYNNEQENVMMQTKADNSAYKATGIVSFKDSTIRNNNADNAGKDPMTVGETTKGTGTQVTADFDNTNNYYWDGAKSAKKDGSTVTAADFASTTFAGVTRDPETGKPSLGDFLKLTSTTKGGADLENAVQETVPEAMLTWPEEDPADKPTTPSNPGDYVDNGNGGVTQVSGDGSKTETVENADGSKTTTTTDKDGNKTIVTEMPDGAKTEIVSKADGEKTITVTDKDGEETVKVEVPATVPAPEAPFTDVPEDHWAKEAIDTMAGLGLVKGVDDVNHIYDMTSNITRGALASVLYRFSNGKAGIESNFSDVLAGAWYTDGVAWAAKVGVVNGYEDGSFGPDNAITRQELAVMLYRYAKLIGMDVSVKAELTRFNDSDAVATWAKDAMTWCTEAGIVKGVGSNTLNPEGVASRAECAVMLSRFIDLV